MYSTVRGNFLPCPMITRRIQSPCLLKSRQKGLDWGSRTRRRRLQAARTVLRKRKPSVLRLARPLRCRLAGFGRSPLVLQPCLRIWRSRLSFLIVAGPGPMLVPSSPFRPAQRQFFPHDPLPQNAKQELPHLGHREFDQSAALFFEPPRPARRRMTASVASAHRLRVMWRCQPTHERTRMSRSLGNPAMIDPFCASLRG